MLLILGMRFRASIREEAAATFITPLSFVDPLGLFMINPCYNNPTPTPAPKREKLTRRSLGRFLCGFQAIFRRGLAGPLSLRHGDIRMRALAFHLEDVHL